MERLYNLPGVKKALEWYADEIVNGTTEIEMERKRGGKYELEEIPLVGCESGKEFERFRERLREKLGGKEKWDEGKLRELREREGKREDKETEEELEERELSDLEKKSADAIAWNWMWCSNLVESVDSRYSELREGESKKRLGKRHGKLAPAVCSDDLRRVFHPQEKYEDKCDGDLEWGAFGKWGMVQLKRIKKRLGIKGKENIIFEAAKSPRDFWQTGKIKEGKVVVLVPECYPTTSMKSFWETYNDGDENVSLLTRLLAKGEDEKPINWRKLSAADPWKTNYLTVRLKKAVELFGYFNPGKLLEERKEREWALPLLDAFRRLGLDNPEKKILSAEEFHNLKMWAVWASYGGVRNPRRKRFTLPLSQMDKAVMRTRLKLPAVKYLEKRERMNFLF